MGAISGGFNQLANSAFGSFGGGNRPNNRQNGFGNQQQGFNNQPQRNQGGNQFGNQNQQNNQGFPDVAGSTDNFLDFQTTVKPKVTKRPPIPGLPSEEDDAPKKCAPVTSSTVPKKPAIPGLPTEEEDACSEDGVGNRIDPNALKSLIG